LIRSVRSTSPFLRKDGIFPRSPFRQTLRSVSRFDPPTQGSPQSSVEPSLFLSEVLSLSRAGACPSFFRLILSFFRRCWKVSVSPAPPLSSSENRLSPLSCWFVSFRAGHVGAYVRRFRPPPTTRTTLPLPAQSFLCPVSFQVNLPLPPL